MLFRTRYNVLFRQFRLLTAQAGSIPAAIRLIFENCYRLNLFLFQPRKRTKQNEHITYHRDKSSVFALMVYGGADGSRTRVRKESG